MKPEQRIPVFFTPPTPHEPPKDKNEPPLQKIRSANEPPETGSKKLLIFFFLFVMISRLCKG